MKGDSNLIAPMLFFLFVWAHTGLQLGLGYLQMLNLPFKPTNLQIVQIS